MSSAPQRWPLKVRDDAGRERSGCLLLAERWHDDLGRPAADEDFRIVVLASPAREVRPQGAVAVCLPSARLEKQVAEAAAAYATAAGPVLPAAALERLRRGRLASALPLGIGPAQVFSARGARWELLARHLLRCLERWRLLRHAAQALWAPAQPPDDPAQVHSRLEEAVAGARAVLTPQAPAELAEAVARLEGWLRNGGGPPPYEGPPALARDLWAVRALAERPREALEVAALRRFLAEAVSNEAELELDRAVAQEQLSYAVLVLEPQRLAAARAACRAFATRYCRFYEALHRSRWQEAHRAREALLSAAPRVRALRLLDTLTELGPPVGGRAVARWEALVRELTPCPGEEPALAEGEARCRRCHLAPDSTPPLPQVEECLRRVDRALSRQRARLARALVSGALSGAAGAVLEPLLRAVQASQVASLPEVLDEALVGHVRRYLVEAGVRRALEPVLATLQRGRAPTAEELSRALSEARRVLERSARALEGSVP